MTTLSLEIPEQTLIPLKQAADELGESVEQLTTKAIQQFLREKAEQKIEAEEHHFQAQHPKLMKQYVNQFIAMHKGKVIDHDLDEIKLYQRVRKQYPWIGILLKKVTVTKETVWTVRSPRLERD